MYYHRKAVPDNNNTFPKGPHHPGSRCTAASPAAAQTAAFSPCSTALEGGRHKSSLPETSFFFSKIPPDRALTCCFQQCLNIHIYLCFPEGFRARSPPQHSHKGGRTTTASPKRTEFLSPEPAWHKGHIITALGGGQGRAAMA